MKKVVKGAKHQTRPSASYYYNEMGVPVGYQVKYRPRKGGKMIFHSLQLRKNGTPYWRAEEKLPTLQRSKRRSSRKSRSTRGRRRSTRGRRRSTCGRRRGKKTTRCTRKRTRRRSNKKGRADPGTPPKSDTREETAKGAVAPTRPPIQNHPVFIELQQLQFNEEGKIVGSTKEIIDHFGNDDIVKILDARFKKIKVDLGTNAPNWASFLDSNRELIGKMVESRR